MGPEMPAINLSVSLFPCGAQEWDVHTNGRCRDLLLSVAARATMLEALTCPISGCHGSKQALARKGLWAKGISAAQMSSSM